MAVQTMWPAAKATPALCRGKRGRWVCIWGSRAVWSQQDQTRICPWLRVCVWRAGGQHPGLWSSCLFAACRCVVFPSSFAIRVPSFIHCLRTKHGVQNEILSFSGTFCHTLRLDFTTQSDVSLLSGDGLMDMSVTEQLSYQSWHI